MDDFIAPPCTEQIQVLFQDEHIVVINKPSGLLSLSGKNPLNLDSVHYRLVKQFPSIVLAHRLDFGTSGVMLLALNKEINGQLTKAFQARTIAKSYESILDGHVAADQGCIDLPIFKDKALFPRLVICHQQGKASTTHYQVLQRLEHPKRSRVIFTPVTGRTHQLRLHSMAIKHPILGCDLYGTDQTLAKAPRLLLHASQLTFAHPHTQAPMVITSPCPF
jgi:tRNA pseudouridine32 synthase/23S rRNA pseudouridine746 synthase